MRDLESDCSESCSAVTFRPVAENNGLQKKNTLMAGLFYFKGHIALYLQSSVLLED